MQLVITITDDNATELATALGYQAAPPASDYSPPALDVFMQDAICQRLRQQLATYRARRASETILAEASAQEL